MHDALNNGCVLGEGDGCLGGDCDIGGDVCLSGVCGGVGDVSVVIGGFTGFCGDAVSMSRQRCGFCPCGSSGGGW